MEKEKLFVYGTLKDSKVQEDLLHMHVNGNRDLLRGFRSGNVHIENRDYKIIEEDSDSKETIEGLVLELSMNKLRVLDKYEGKNYRRKKVKLTSGNEAWAYIK